MRCAMSALELSLRFAMSGLELSYALCDVGFGN
jgi:hypothetical protein